MKLLVKICVVALFAPVLVSCVDHVRSTACRDLQAGHADSAMVLLTDVGSPSFRRTAERVANEPSEAFAAHDLGLNTDPGMVVLATYDARGQVVERGAFNLGGVADSSLQRRANAKDQARCLRAAAVAISTHGPSGDLLRSISPAAEVAATYSAARHVGILAFGLGRSGGDGFKVATADLGSRARRTYALNELSRVGLIPHLRGRPGLLLVAPSESIRSGISAAGVNAFAVDLCQRLSAKPCSADEALS